LLLCVEDVASTVSYCGDNINKIKTTPFLSLDNSVEQCRKCMFIAEVPLFIWDFV